MLWIEIWCKQLTLQNDKESLCKNEYFILAALTENKNETTVFLHWGVNLKLS